MISWEESASEAGLNKQNRSFFTSTWILNQCDQFTAIHVYFFSSWRKLIRRLCHVKMEMIHVSAFLWRQVPAPTHPPKQCKALKKNGLYVMFKKHKKQIILLCLIHVLWPLSKSYCRQFVIVDLFRMLHFCLSCFCSRISIFIGFVM